MSITPTIPTVPTVISTLSSLTIGSATTNESATTTESATTATATTATTAATTESNTYQANDILYGQYYTGDNRFYLVIKNSPKTIRVIGLKVYKSGLPSRQTYGNEFRIKKKDGYLYNGATGYLVRWKGDLDQAASDFRQANVKGNEMKKKIYLDKHEKLEREKHESDTSGGVFNIGDVWQSVATYINGYHKYYTIVKHSAKTVVVRQVEIDGQGHVTKELDFKYRHRVKKDGDRMNSKATGLLEPYQPKI